MKDVKSLEKKHGTLKRRRMEELNPDERIWNYYFNMDYDIILSPQEEQSRKILEHAYEAVLKYFPGYSIHRIASFVCRSISLHLSITRTHRQCINYVNKSINLFGEPVDIEKEKRKQLYISRLHQLSTKAEKLKNIDGAVKALSKAADLENFNEDIDEKMREMIKGQEAKEIVFASSADQLKALIAERRKQTEEYEDAEIIEDGE